jgi:hypothetical protein
VWYGKRAEEEGRAEHPDHGPKPRDDTPGEVVQPPEVIDRKAILKNEEAGAVSFQEDVIS